MSAVCTDEGVTFRDAGLDRGRPKWVRRPSPDRRLNAPRALFDRLRAKEALVKVGIAKSTLRGSRKRVELWQLTTEPECTSIRRRLPRSDSWFPFTICGLRRRGARCYLPALVAPVAGPC